MTIRPLATALTLAVSALALAACGSSTTSSSVSGPNPSSGSSGGPSVTANSGGGTYTTGSSGGAAASGGAALAAGVARCKSAIAAAPQLSADAKSKLESLCDQAAHGNPAQLRKVSSQVCQEIVKQSVPASAQQQALAACPKP